MTVGNERVVGVKLLLDSFGLEYALNAQHFLNLVSNGRGVFKVKPNVLTQRQLPVLLVRHDFGAKVSALCRVFLKAPQIISC